MLKLNIGQAFDKQISQLIVVMSEDYLNNLGLNRCPNVVTIFFNVFCLFMEHIITCNMHGGLVITHERQWFTARNSQICKRPLGQMSSQAVKAIARYSTSALY